MTVLTDERPESLAPSNYETRVLFPEARARRQRIRFLAGALAVLLVAAGLVGASIGGLIGSHPSSTVSASGGLGVGLGTTAAPRSEIATISVETNPASDPYGPTDYLREAVALGTSRPSIQVLTAKGPEFYDMPRVVEGVYYSADTDNGRVVGWQTARIPWGIPTPLSPLARANNLNFLKRISLEPIVRIGSADVGGTPTTEYRVLVSVVRLYTFRTPDGALAFLIYKLAYPSLGLPHLAFPLEVWVDRQGHVLQVRTGVPAIPPVPGPGVSARTYTVTLSGFGVGVRVSAPARNELIQPSGLTSFSSTVSGTIHVRSTGGSDSTERGLLLLSTTVVSGKAAGRTFISQPIAVGPNGTYAAKVDGSPSRSPQTLQFIDQIRLGATFYLEGGAVLTCGTRPTEYFPTGASTGVIDFVCS